MRQQRDYFLFFTPVEMFSYKSLLFLETALCFNA